MYLQDNRADVKLIHSRSTAFEVWWLWENEVFVVSHCPENYPSTVVHTMKIEQSLDELKKLTSEGWKVKKSSERFNELRNG